MNADQDDWQLVNSASTDKQAIRLLFERHKDYVYRLAYGFLADKALADDVVQSVFLKLQEKKRKLKPQAKFTTWLYQFSLNTAREVARKKGRLVSVSDIQMNDLNNEITKNDATEAIINFHDLSKSLTSLPERQREIFILRYLEGFNTRETAEIVGCKEGTVKTHLARATEAIKNKLNIENKSETSSISTLSI